MTWPLLQPLLFLLMLATTMNNYILYVLSFLLFASCLNGKERNNEISQTDRFLNLFENLNTDTLTIKSINYLTDSIEYNFRGKIIDTTYYQFISDRYLDAGLNEYSQDNYYACFKKQLDDSTYLLVLRTPYEYWESSVKFYLFNLKKSITTDFIEVAQKYGDAGDYIEKHSVLNGLNFALYEKTCWLLNEDTMETDCKDSIKNFRIEKREFILLNKNELKK